MWNEHFSVPLDVLKWSSDILTGFRTFSFRDILIDVDYVDVAWIDVTTIKERNQCLKILLNLEDIIDRLFSDV